MKKALNESTVRKFMKLANIGGLTENFVDKTIKGEEDTEEVDTLEEMGGELDELPPEEMGAELDELPPEEDAMGDVPPETVEAIVDAIADALESVTGVEINVDSAGGGEEVELDAEEEGGEEELLGTAEDALDDPAGEEWDEVEEALDAADVSLEEKFNQEAFINEVTKRVAKRLLSLSKKR